MITRLLTAKELDLWDYKLPENCALSVYPPAREHTWDPFWWDQGGRDPLDRKFIFRLEAGPERTERLREIIKDYPRYGPKMYEKCADTGRADILQELLSLGASLNIEEAKRQNEAVSEADQDDDVPMAKMEPAIFGAAFEGHLDCVRLLVEQGGVDTNVRDNKQATALSFAACKGHAEIVKYLLDHDTKITWHREGVNDIEAGIKSGSVEVVTLLLNSSQSLSRSFQFTAYHLRLAAYSGNYHIIQFVLERAGFPADHTTHDSSMDVGLPGITTEQKEAITESLSHAIASGQVESVRLLLSYLTLRQADGSFKRLESDDVLHTQVFNAIKDAMEGATDVPELFELVWKTILCPSQAALEASSEARELKYNLLHRRLISACAEGCPETVKLMCEKYDANINHISYKYFSTPLGRAVVSSKNPLPPRLEIAKYLLERPGIDIHLAYGEYSNGMTPMAIAVDQAEFGQAEMLGLMFEYGGPVEDISDSVLEDIKTLGVSQEVTVCVVLFKDEPRFPVRIMTEDGYRLIPEGRRTVKATISMEGERAERMISKLQLRKSNVALAASDPMGRPLKTDQ